MKTMTDRIPVLDTPRLTLRAPALRDLGALTAFYATERSHFVGGPLDVNGAFSQLTGRIGHWALKGFGLWHIEDRETGAFVGWTGLIDPPGWAEPELAWTVLSEGEGKGFAQEAATAARAHAATHLGHDRPISYIRPDNDRSMALASRLGATVEDTCDWRGKPVHIYRHPTAKGAA